MHHKLTILGPGDRYLLTEYGRNASNLRNLELNGSVELLRSGGGIVLDQANTPTLEDLRDAPGPAWLWDCGRLRIVWANSAGTTFFGGETLFDLLDHPFDPAEPGVERIAALCGQLRRGAAQHIELAFPS